MMLRKTFRYSLLSACALLLGQLPSFAYQVDKTNHIINVKPGASPAVTTNDLRSALSYLSARPDKTTLWTLKFAPGKYVLSAQLSANGLQNAILSSNPNAPAQLIKMPGWNSATSGENLLSVRLGSKVQLLGFEFYGQTNFAKGPNPYWPDQGVYLGSCNIVKVDGNKFFNFGNAALRVVTDSRDPVPGVNSFKTQVSNNTFNNIYQTASTSVDKIHGGTALSTWSNNTFVNLRGSIKFASRTPGARQIEFVNNVVNGSDHFGLEVNNYSDFTVKGNIFQNIKEYAMTIYTNGDGSLMSRGFPWGDNFNISGNTIRNVAYAIRYSHAPFWDKIQNVPKNLVIDNNTISTVTNKTSYVPVIAITGGQVNGVKITNNHMSGILNKKYIDVQPGSQNVSILNNTANGVAYRAQATTASK